MTDTQEILVNKKAYLELKASHDRLKEACLIIKEFENVTTHSIQWTELALKHVRLNDEALILAP